MTNQELLDEVKDAYFVKNTALSHIVTGGYVLFGDVAAPLRLRRHYHEFRGTKEIVNELQRAYDKSALVYDLDPRLGREVFFARVAEVAKARGLQW